MKLALDHALERRYSVLLEGTFRDPGMVTGQLAVGLVERAAYRDIFDFSKTLSELESDTTSGLENARGNAAKLAASVIEAIREEYPQ